MFDDSRHIASASCVDQRYRWSANHTASTSRTQGSGGVPNGGMSCVPGCPSLWKGPAKVKGPCFRKDLLDVVVDGFSFADLGHFCSKTNPWHAASFRAENVWDIAFYPLAAVILIALRMGSRAVLCTWSFKGLPRWFSAICTEHYGNMIKYHHVLYHSKASLYQWITQPYMICFGKPGLFLMTGTNRCN